MNSCFFLMHLRSEKLKPFWLSITEKEKLPQLDFLAAALLSRQTNSNYLRALTRARRMTRSKVVPFFGVFIRDLKTTLSQNPSIIVVSSNDNAVPIIRVNIYFHVGLLLIFKNVVIVFWILEHFWALMWHIILSDVTRRLIAIQKKYRYLNCCLMLIHYFIVSI